MPTDYSFDVEENKATANATDKYEPTADELLEFLKLDIHRDVSGSIPLSGINYLWVTIRFMGLFKDIEETLKAARDPLWVRAYDSGAMGPEKRTNFALLVLDLEDDATMRVIADKFESPRAGFLDHVYWEEVDVGDAKCLKRPSGEGEMPGCCVM